MKSHPIRGCRSGFTLMELMIVIAILALLMTILVPALNAAKDRANQVRCLASARGAGSSFMIYANDFQEYPTNYPANEHAYAWTMHSTSTGLEEAQGYMNGPAYNPGSGVTGTSKVNTASYANVSGFTLPTGVNGSSALARAVYTKHVQAGTAECNAGNRSKDYWNIKVNADANLPWDGGRHPTNQPFYMYNGPRAIGREMHFYSAMSGLLPLGHKYQDARAATASMGAATDPDYNMSYAKPSKKFALSAVAFMVCPTLNQGAQTWAASSISSGFAFKEPHEKRKYAYTLAGQFPKEVLPPDNEPYPYGDPNKAPNPQKPSAPYARNVIYGDGSGKFIHTPGRDPYTYSVWPALEGRP